MNGSEMFQSAGLLIICVTICFHLAEPAEPAEPERRVYGFISETVVLKPGVDPSWTFKDVQWSIFTNTTLIATFQSGVENINRFYQFKNRLELNAATGDLTIKSLTARDSLRYTVTLEGRDLEEKVIHFCLDVGVSVIREPSVNVKHRVLDSGKCVISLSCSSSNSNITLSWRSDPGFIEYIFSNKKNSRESELWSSFNNREVTFHCSATDGKETKQNSTTVKCSEPKPQNGSNLQNIHGNTRIPILPVLLGFFAGMFVGFLICKIRRGNRHRRGYDAPTGKAELQQQTPVMDSTSVSVEQKAEAAVETGSPNLDDLKTDEGEALMKVKP